MKLLLLQQYCLAWFLPTLLPTVLDISGDAIDTDTLGGKWEVKGPFLVGSNVNNGAALTAETAVKAVSVDSNTDVKYNLPAKNNTAIAEGVFTATYTRMQLKLKFML